jgi:cytochrome d ubiquinol oxidase subunit II
VPVGNASGDALTSWWNETSVLVGVLTVAVGAHVAAVFLAADAVRAGQPDLVQAFRRRALGSGVVAGALAIAGLLVVREDARPLYDGLTSDAGLALVICSAVAGLATLALEWRSRFELARYIAAVAVGAIVAGWAVAQRPDVLPGELTLDAAAASDATLAVLVGSIGVGMLVLLPSLRYLFRLVLGGKLDTEFHPLTTGDDRTQA